MKKLKTFAAFAALLLVCAVLAFAGCGQDKEDDPPINILDSARYSVAAIRFGASQGSGTVISVEGGSALIATNYHVVEGSITAQKVDGQLVYEGWVHVRFYGEEAMVKGTIVGICKDYDLAVLRTDSAPDSALALTDWGDAEVGERIYSLAYGRDIRPTFSAFDGMVSTAAMLINTNYGKNIYVTETTAVSPYGSSGGPCMTEDGRLVGINGYSAAADGVVQGLSYKIPASILRALVDTIVGESKNTMVDLALPFVIGGSGGITVTCFDGDFTVLPLPNGLVVSESKYTPLPEDSIIRKANGVDANVLTLIAELIKTGKDTVLK